MKSSVTAAFGLIGLCVSTPAVAAVEITGSGTLSGPTIDYGDPTALKAALGLQPINSFSFRMVVPDLLIPNEPGSWFENSTNFDFYLNGIKLISSDTLGTDAFSETRYQGDNLAGLDDAAIYFVRQADILPDVAGLEFITFNLAGIWFDDPFIAGSSYSDFEAFGSTNFFRTEFSITQANSSNSFSYSTQVRGAPLPVSVSAVPEPATWALMLLGYFGVGGVMRYKRSKQKVKVSYA